MLGKRGSPNRANLVFHEEIWRRMPCCSAPLFFPEGRDSRVGRALPRELPDAAFTRADILGVLRLLLSRFRSLVVAQDDMTEAVFFA